MRTQPTTFMHTFYSGCALKEKPPQIKGQNKKEKKRKSQMAFDKNMNVENSFETGSDLSLNNIISNILKEVSMIDDVSEKLSRLEYYVSLLKAELRKLDGFKRELPLCMSLLNDGIGILNEETLKLKGKRVDPVMEEEFTSLTSGGIGRARSSNDVNEKKNWLSSAQLWTASVEYEGDRDEAANPKSNHQGENGVCMHFGGGAFVSYQRQMKDRKRMAFPVNHGLTLLPPADVEDVKLKKPQLEEQHEKKQRRCWSSELHKKFVDSLHLLGGAKTATPKQIRELMKVEGLTNDEVKSHLQKYRIHLRKIESEGPGNLVWLARNDPLKLSMATSSSVSPQGHSAANEASSSKAKSEEEEKSVSPSVPFPKIEKPGGL